jgi:hypothetical protein
MTSSLISAQWRKARQAPPIEWSSLPAITRFGRNHRRC